MPFTKTEVDVHTDYVVETVDPDWLAKGVKSPKHLYREHDAETGLALIRI